MLFAKSTPVSSLGIKVKRVSPVVVSVSCLLSSAQAMSTKRARAVSRNKYVVLLSIQLICCCEE